MAVTDGCLCLRKEVATQPVTPNEYQATFGGFWWTIDMNSLEPDGAVSFKKTHSAEKLIRQDPCGDHTAEDSLCIILRAEESILRKKGTHSSKHCVGLQ